MDPNLPRPMFSLKVAYVLSDLSETAGRHQGHPGQPPEELAAPARGHRVANPEPEGTVEITANPGDASSSTGGCGTRARRTARRDPQDAVHRLHLPVDPSARRHAARRGEWWAQPHPRAAPADRLRHDTANYWGINWDGYIDEEIPLRKELKKRGLLDRTIPWLR